MATGVSTVWEFMNEPSFKETTTSRKSIVNSLFTYHKVGKVGYLLTGNKLKVVLG